jgi:hypothetical protein
VIQAVMNFDYLQPVTKRGAAFEVLHAKVCFQENFLRQVFRHTLVAGNMPAVSHNPPLVLFD